MIVRRRRGGARGIAFAEDLEKTLGRVGHRWTSSFISDKCLVFTRYSWVTNLLLVCLANNVAMIVMSMTYRIIIFIVFLLHDLSSLYKKHFSNKKTFTTEQLRTLLIR